MCNLYKNRKSLEEIARLFRAELNEEIRYSNLVSDVFPGMPSAVVTAKGEQRSVRKMTWGFPLVTRDMRSRAEKAGKSPKPKPVNNARELKSSFWRSSAANPEGRCLIPVEMFAEAEGPKGGKTRTWFAVADEPLFAWAGLWRPSAEWGDVYSGVMTEANSLVSPVHDRMPVILAPEDQDRWLYGSFDDVLALQKPFPANLMTQEATDEPWAGRK